MSAISSMRSGASKSLASLRRTVRGTVLRGLFVGTVAIMVGVPGAGILLYGLVPPPATPLMILRLFEGEGIARHWRARGDIAPDLFRAVIAAEDARFCEHLGFDTVELAKALRDWRRGRRVRGASTITMQTAKNLFLWPGRTLARKAAEAYLTPWLEMGWSKARILELYVNIAEWGPGIYGAEAAARAFFGKPASALSAKEAALMAAVLPNPRAWSPDKPSSYVRARARTIRARMGDAPVSEGRICSPASG